MSNVRAKQVVICIFTPKDMGNVGQYPAQEQYLYQMFGNAILELRKLHGNDVPVFLDFCPVSGNQNNLVVLEQNGGSLLNLPAVQIYAKYPDGTAGQYFLKKGITDQGSSTPLVDEQKALAYTQALLYHLSPTPQTLLCKILPPLCSLGWYVWLGAALYTTYRTTQAINVGKYVWGGAAALTWNEFIERGGLNELAKKVGIGATPYFKHNGKELQIIATVRYDTGKRPALEKEMKEKGIIATHWLSTKQSGTPKYAINEYEDGHFGRITSWK